MTSSRPSSTRPGSPRSRWSGGRNALPGRHGRIDEGRIVLTFDLDFSEIAALSGDEVTSVISFRLRNTLPTNVISRLKAVLTASTPALKEGVVVSVEDTGHRIRKLPIGRG